MEKVVKFSFLVMSGLLLLGAGVGLAAESAETSDNEMEEPWYEDYYEDWYRVEVVIFAHRHPPAGNEIWPLAEPVYPANMVAIAPARAEDITPHELGQLEDLMAYERLLANSLDNQTEPAATDEFMFENKSRFNRDPVLAEAARQADTLDSDSTDTNPPVIPDDLFREEFPKAFRAVTDENPQLARTYGSLNRSSNYRVLQRLAWLQPLGEESRFPVLMQAGQRYDGTWELDGTITVTLQRFLHADVDLWFTEFAPRRQSRQFGRASDPDMPDVGQAVLNRYPQLVARAEQSGAQSPIHTHPLTQSRRMRSDTTHFIDHPFFGVIIRVTEFEYEPEVPTPDE